MNEMNDILAIVNKREEELIRAIEKAKKDEAIFPDGHLRINNNAGQTRYYKMTKRGDTTGEYLSVKNMDTIRLLAQKDYSRKFLKKAKAELKAIHLIRKQLTKECTEASYENLSIERQELVKPYILSDTQYAECWQSIKFKPNPYEPEKKIYDTRKGDKVRSKSEAIIADMLYEMKIPYFYEKK